MTPAEMLFLVPWGFCAVLLVLGAYHVTRLYRTPRCIASGYRCKDARDPRCVARHCTWHCSLYCGGACRRAWLERERAKIARGLAVGAALDDSPADRESSLKSTLPVRRIRR